MAEKKGFVVYTNYKKKFEDLTDSQFRQLWDAIFDYEKTQMPPEISDVAVKAYFNVVRVDLDDNRNEYAETCVKNKKNAEARWQKERAKNATAYERMPEVPPNANGAKRADKIGQGMTGDEMTGDDPYERDIAAREEIKKRAREDITGLTHGEMIIAAEELLIDEYVKYFDDPDNAREIVIDLIKDFGCDMASECIREVGARASPVQVPPKYIRAMCENRAGGSDIKLGGG
jgi:hypothetical protein